MGRNHDLLTGRGQLYVSAEKGAAFPLPATKRKKALEFQVTPTDNYVMVNEAAASGRNGEGLSFTGSSTDVTFAQKGQWFKPQTTTDTPLVRPSIHDILIMGGFGHPEYVAAVGLEPSKLIYDANDFPCDSNAGLIEFWKETCTQDEYELERVTGVRGNLVMTFDKDGMKVELESAKGASYLFGDAGRQISSLDIQTATAATPYSWTIDAVAGSITSVGATFPLIAQEIVDALKLEGYDAWVQDGPNGVVEFRGKSIAAFTLVATTANLVAAEVRPAVAPPNGVNDTNAIIPFLNWTWSLSTVEAKPIVYDSPALTSLKISMAVEIIEQLGPGNETGVAQIDLVIGKPIEVEAQLKLKNGDQNLIALARGNKYFKLKVDIENMGDANNHFILGEKNGGTFLQVSETPTLADNGNWQFVDVKWVTLYPEKVPGDLKPAEQYNTMFSVAFTGDTL